MPPALTASNLCATTFASPSPPARSKKGWELSTRARINSGFCVLRCGQSAGMPRTPHASRTTTPQLRSQRLGFAKAPGSLAPALGVRWLAGNGADTALGRYLIAPLNIDGPRRKRCVPCPLPTALQDASRPHRHVRKSEACRESDVEPRQSFTRRRGGKSETRSKAKAYPGKAEGPKHHAEARRIKRGAEKISSS